MQSSQEGNARVGGDDYYYFDNSLRQAYAIIFLLTISGKGKNMLTIRVEVLLRTL